MKKSAFLIFSIISIFQIQIVLAQQAQDSIPGPLGNFVKDGSSHSFIRFKEDKNIAPEKLFTEYKAGLMLGPDDEMVMYKKTEDELGFTHLKFQQYYKNTPVEGGEYIIHINKNGHTYAANGHLATKIELDVSPSITAAKSIDLSLKVADAQTYKWNSPEWQDELKTRTRHADTSYFPKPVLVIFEDSKVSQKFHLAYRVDVYALSPNYAQRIYIDAKTGLHLASIPLQSN